MASAQDLRKRIKSVTNTQQITKAMKMVASARLRRAQTKAMATLPYAEKLDSMLQNISAFLVNDESFEANPLLQSREVRKTAYLVIGADKGLAGSYTSNMVKYVLNEVEGKSKDSYVIITVGKKPTEHLTRKRLNVIASFKGFSDKPTFEHAEELSEKLEHLFISEEVDEVVMIYTYFVNSLTQEVRKTQLLPVNTESMAKVEGRAVESKVEYIFVPDAKAVYEKLLPRFIEINIYNGMLQSAASELGARMTAMTSATDNAGELIAKLDLYYNKIRQAGITNEISEIVGGANALE